MMELESKTKIQKATIWLIIGSTIFILSLPITLFFIKDFPTTGQIGDTIGGVTAPLINIASAILVYLAFRAQIDANNKVQKQIDDENESKDLSQLYSYLDASINNFKFTYPSRTFPSGALINADTYSGAEAFFQLFDKINCEYHGSEETLLEDVSISELYSILEIMNVLLEKLKHSKISNKEVYTTLIKHLFNYKIATRLRSVTDENIFYCESCKCNHGLPNKILKTISEIREKIE